MLIFFFFGLVVSLLLLVRNAWVFDTREIWLARDWRGYQRAVSYDRMMFRVWCWSADIAKWQK